MESPSSATAIPLPFATAGVGLCLSYFFSTHVNAPIATGIGFLVGVLALYFFGHTREKSGRDSSRSAGSPKPLRQKRRPIAAHPMGKEEDSIYE